MILVTTSFPSPRGVQPRRLHAGREDRGGGPPDEVLSRPASAGLRRFLDPVCWRRRRWAVFRNSSCAGWETTVLVAAISGTFGMLVGLAGAAAKLSRFRVLRMIADAYTTIVRGVPELLVILLVYFGGTAALTALVGSYVEVSALGGVFSLTVVFGAYATEIFRGAIQAIPRGQTEAALSIGLAPWQTWLLVILPQMARIALPALCNLWISLLKDTSLISIVGLSDIMRVAVVGAGSMRDPLTFYLAASVLYLMLTSVSLLTFRFVERRMLAPCIEGYDNGYRPHHRSIETLLGGVVLTLELTILSLLIGFVLSVPLAFMRASRSPWLSWPVLAYTYVFRGTPLLVQLFLIYYGLGQIAFVRESFLWLLFRDPFYCALLAFSLNSAAYTIEVFRGGIQSVPPGLVEAAQAIGLSPTQDPPADRVPARLPHRVALLCQRSGRHDQGELLASTVTLLEITGIGAKAGVGDLRALRGLHRRRRDLSWADLPGLAAVQPH